MPTANVNGVKLYYELNGEGEFPLVFVHGSWSTHQTWDAIVPALPEQFRILTYDRRGHSRSERPPGQGSIREDVADLAGLIEQLHLAPAWVIGNSQGALIALRLAGQRPDLLRGISRHEPPLFSLVADEPSAMLLLEEMEKLDAAVVERIAAGDSAGGTELFIDTIASPGAFAELPGAYQEELIYNAPTYLDEIQDPENTDFDPAWVKEFPRPVLLTTGDESEPIFVLMYAKVAELLPEVKIQVLSGAGHVPQRYQPEAYIEVLLAFIRE
jgi:pimeloyl-ACP methyl ester carboxylesterase